MTHVPQTRRRPTARYTAFGVAALPLILGAVLIISDHAVGIAWALLVCGGGLLSVALTQPRRDHDEPASGGRVGSGAQRDMDI
jgi:peptidoglycan/LPS O-acetylase OafA/YrhL